ncbi:beta strand repeat-containing protein [Roseococcus sp.]|uniref:beta strand repeat-containing protein n=1 Tax=Roseococcus sp. TaxID=2109646 RepID=UPI003BAC5BBA
MMATSPKTLRAALLAGTALIFPALAQAQPAANARPQGGAVVAGSATIGGDAGRTVINQTTDRAAINWQSFDVGRNQAVQFQQPSSSSITLNRVISPNPSQIAGQITANGQIAIVNQSGVVFHQGSTVNAAGLVVSTANISNEAFMRGGRMNFDQPGRPDARIENNGTITVREAGLAALVAPQVANRGVIRARMGRVVLAGAETSVVDLHGDGLLSLEVTSPVRQAPTNGEALVTNTGTVTATGGTVVLTASAVDGIVQDLVRAGGRIAANTDAATRRTGRVVVTGNGGAVRIEGQVSAEGLAAGTRGGDIQILGERTLVDSTARVNASGRTGGGTIAVGGIAPRNTTRLARRTGVAQGAEIRADATERGNGGTVVVNSSEYTVHAGTISARGGPQGGNGGFIEISGQQGLAIMGRVDVSAGPNGRGGTFLIDPTTITIVADGDPTVNTSTTDFTGAILGSASPPTTSVIAAGIVNDPIFNGSTIELQATQTITVNSAINRTSIGGLTFTAGTDIFVNAPITLASGNLTMTGANITISGALLTLNGGISLTASGNFLTINSPMTAVGGDITVTGQASGGSLVTIAGAVQTQNGNISLSAEGEGGTLFINAPVTAGGGNITLTGRSFTTGIQLGALVQVDSTHLITTQGSIATSNTEGRFVGGALNVTQTGTDTELLNDNNVLELRGMDSTGANRFRNVGSLRVTGNVGNGSNAYASIDVVGGDLTIASAVGGGGGFGNVDGAVALLRASGNIILGSGGSVSAPSIRMQAGYDFTAGAPNPAAAGGIQLAGFISDFSGSSGAAVELAAGTSGIIQTSGELAAGQLNIVSGGNVVLASGEGGNPVDVLGTSTIAGDLTFYGRGNYANDMTLQGTIRVGGTTTIDIANGSLLQTTGSSLITPTLAARSYFNSITLMGDNQIGTITQMIGEGSASVRNTQSLRITGAFESRSAAAVIDVVGGDLDITSTGHVIGDGGVQIRASGSIRTEAGSYVELEPSFNPQISLLAGFDFTNGFPNSSANAGMTLGGRIGSLSGGDFITLAAGLGGIRQTGGQILGSTLSVQSGGDALLNGASASLPNRISSLTNIFVPGDFAFDNGVSNLAVGTFGSPFTGQSFAIRTAGNVVLNMPINATQRATFRVGSLTISPPSSGPAPGITAPLVEIAPDASVGMAVFPGPSSPQPFQVTAGMLGRITAGTLRLGATTFGGVTTTTASEISFASSYSFPGTLDVRATGNIFQAPGTVLTLGTLAGAAGGSLQLTEAANVLPVIGDLSAGTTLALVTTGSQSLTGTLAAPSVSLKTGGTLTESGAGRISAGTLALQTAGAATLAGANAIDRLAASTIGGDFRLTNTSNQLNIPGGNLVNAAGFLSIGQTGDLVVDGTVSGTATSLLASGRLQVNGNSAIARTGNLNIQSSVFGLNGLLQAQGEIRINATSSANLAGTANGSLLTVNSPSVTFNGLNAANTPVQLFLGTGGTTTGTLSASALSVFGGASANLFGSIGGIADGSAAAKGQRGTAGGTLLAEPLPRPTSYLFNNCAIGAAVCTPVVPAAFQFTPFFATAVNPGSQLAALEMAATMAQQLRPPVPAFSFRLYRDRSEEGELAPPNVRGEDF